MLSNDEIKRLIELWQERLRLRDWFIITKIVEEEEDELLKDRAGQVDIRSSVFEAIVELNSTTPDDQIESTIYHELAHIQVKEIFWPLRQILELKEPEDDNTLTDLLDVCEELQVRNIEFLISRTIGTPRIMEEK